MENNVMIEVAFWHEKDLCKKAHTVYCTDFAAALKVVELESKTQELNIECRGNGHIVVHANGYVFVVIEVPVKDLDDICEEYGS